MVGMGKETAKRGVYAVFGALLGVFLLIRLKGFVLQAWNAELPVWSLGAGVLLLAALAAAFFRPLEAFLRRWTWFPRAGCLAVYGVSLLAMFPMQGILLGRALENTGIGMSPLTRVLYLLGGGLLLGTFLLCCARSLWELGPGLKRFFAQVTWRDGVFLLVLLIVLNGLVLLYAKNSATIYFWDNAGYWRVAHQLAELWMEQGVTALLRTVYDSVLTLDYNYLIALPATLFARMFGESRYVFLAAILNFGYVPLLLLIWAAAKRKTRYPAAATLTVLFLLPYMMRCVVEGFVDVSGCVLTLSALLLYLLDQNRNDFGRFLLLGVCLAGAVLLRRWYAFFAVACLLALALDCICFRRSAVPFLGAVAGAAFTLGFGFQPLVSQRLMADYSSLYVAYDMGLDRDVLMVCFNEGFLVLAALLTANLWLIRRRDSRETGVFLLVTTVLCYLLFIRVQTHGQQHLLLYAPVQIIIVLLTVARLQALEKRRVTALVLAVSLLPTLSPFLPGERPGSILELENPEPLPAFSWRPPCRDDAQEIVALIRRLDRFGEQGKTVGVLASSFQLNKEILVNAEASLSIPRVSEVDRSYLMTLPQVDQRDGWQDRLFQCDILVVADPVQVHLEPENQMVVMLPAEELLEGTGFSAAYRQMEETMQVGDLTVCFFEKVREPTEEEQEELRSRFYALHPDAP